ncbi:hypothetical protein EVAR_100899_1 [Eumeta japonica]|uniref:Uncharacterized protein n=1 Tax=Eumeta variegata TaxID=151549 RepID=A0A4C1SX76_EUMVA|nr:hypothetical protein EVAR_100899_1 [Eumeta japonica]
MEDQPSPKDRIERVCTPGKTCQSAEDPCACGAEAIPGACGAPLRRHSIAPGFHIVFTFLFLMGYEPQALRLRAGHRHRRAFSP